MAQHPVIGYLVWVVLFGALFAWEGLALSHVSGVPTLSDAFRVIMRYPFGRWALWLIRRRHGEAAASGSRRDQEAAAAAGARDQEAAAAAGPVGTAGPRPDWLRLARYYSGTAIGGYLLLMAIVSLYYYGAARVGGAFIASAFTGCALLIGLSTLVFALASWLAERRRAYSASHRDPPTTSAP